MVALPHIKHLPREFGKVGIHGKTGLKTIVGGLLKAPPGINDVVRDIQEFALVVVHGNIEDSIAISVIIDKLVRKALHINLIDWPYIEGEGLQTIDPQSQLLLRLDAQAANDGVGVAPLLLAKQHLALVNSEALRHTIISILSDWSGLLIL